MEKILSLIVILSLQLFAEEMSSSVIVGVEGPPVVEEISDVSNLPTKDELVGKEESDALFKRLVSTLGYEVEVFGHDFLNSGSTPLKAGSIVNSEYRIGPGDKLEVSVWGSVQKKYELTVASDGRVNFENHGLINVAGLKFGELNGFFTKEIGRYYKNFELNVAMVDLRDIQVYMLGEVKNPGVVNVAMPATLSQLLASSENVSRRGSLRKVELRRGDSLVAVFDLYKILVNGSLESDIGVQDGDVVFVPPVKKQVAIVSGVAKPGIYELLGGETLYDLSEMAGGYEDNISNTPFRVERFVKQKGFVVSMNDFQDFGKSYYLNKSDVISMGVSFPRFENAVTLRGHVASPSRYPFKEGMRISDVITSQKMLITDDFWAFQNIAVGKKSSTIESNEVAVSVNWEYAIIERFNPQTLEVELLPFELGAVVLKGDSKQDLKLQPGDVITVFGGNDFAIPVSKRSIYVSISGEVNKVGTYKMKYGETLEDLIERAGGITPNAYLFGSEFYRASVKQIQQQNYARLIKEIERQVNAQASQELSGVSGAEEAKVAARQVEAQGAWVEELKQYEPSGRLVLELEEEIDLDVEDLPNFILEDGDQLVIPSFPSVVSVFGEVPMQNAFLYKKTDDVGDYLERAGGIGKYADDDESFVIRADGTVVSERNYGFLFWQLRSMGVLPGDALFVPRNLEYSRWLPIAKDVTQILANFGLTAAALVTLSRGI